MLIQFLKNADKLFYFLVMPLFASERAFTRPFSPRITSLGPLVILDMLNILVIASSFETPLVPILDRTVAYFDSFVGLVKFYKILCE